MSSFLALTFALAALTHAPAPHFAQMALHAPRAKLAVEIADTERKREYGLMNRTLLPARHGMIFVFSQDGVANFWMKNTLIALDMVFISGEGRVRSVAQAVPASTAQTPDSKVARRSGFAKYVLELPAREARRDGLVPGALVPELRP